MKTVDVIIPSYKPDKKFMELLERLHQQSYPIDNIIVFNTEEKYWNKLFYEKRAMLQGLSNLRLFHYSKREFDHGMTRNRAAKKSNADIIVYMTQDAVPADHKVISSLVEALEEESVAVAYARQLASEESSELEKASRMFNYPPEGKVKSLKDLPELGIKTYFCSNVCAAYKKEVFKKLGGFTKRTIFNEDMIFAATIIKAGYKIAYVPSAKVIHAHNYTYRQQFKRNFDLGVSQADHPEVFKEVPSESEGIKLVKATRQQLIKEGKRKKLLSFYWMSACKLLGYQFGKHYRILPNYCIKKCTMNLEYWRNEK